MKEATRQASLCVIASRLRQRGRLGLIVNFARKIRRQGSLTLGLLALALGACRVRSAAPDKRASAAPSASLSLSSTLAAPSAGLEASVRVQQPASAFASPTLAFVAVAGIGTDPKQVESVQVALELARQAREAGASCLDAAVAGVAALEDDPSLNAGTGAALRLDGSAELEAAVMTSTGRFAAVTGLSAVQYPSRVARAVLDTPHRVLAGVGAQRFARLLGNDAFDVRTEAVKQRYKSLMGELGAGGAEASPADVTAWSSGVGGSPDAWRAYLPKPPTLPPLQPGSRCIWAACKCPAFSRADAPAASLRFERAASPGTGRRRHRGAPGALRRKRFCRRSERWGPLAELARQSGGHPRAGRGLVRRPQGGSVRDGTRRSYPR